jgi:hypothetical protein
MPISVQCPGCGKSLKGPDELAGKRVKCPKCGRQFQLPAHVSSAAQPTGTAPPLSNSPPLQLVSRENLWWSIGAIWVLLVIGLSIVLLAIGEAPLPEWDPPQGKVIHGWVAALWLLLTGAGIIVAQAAYHEANPLADVWPQWTGCGLIMPVVGIVFFGRYLFLVF